MRATLAVLTLIFSAAPAAAQMPAPGPMHDTAPAYRLAAVRAVAPIRVDGVLDEAAWASAPAATEFVQNTPTPGAPASERTEVRILYTDQAIYIGARMYDSSPDSIAAQLARRDAGGIYSDWLHVVLDSYHDRRTAFRFSLNPLGVKKDVLHYDDSMEDVGWNAVWHAAARMDGEGWIAEFEIPLSQLRFAGTGGEQIWGANFRREIARRNERADWAPIRPEVQGFVSQFGELVGLRDLPAPRQLEIQPYSVARMKRAPGSKADPFWSENEGALALGADVKYGVTSNLTLTATINPDFGQVEADPSQVNLTAYESFYREQRPFFTEGANIFRFKVGVNDGSGESLFYSRRIGRTPQRRVSESEGHVDAPETTTILGAAKLSGKTAGGWSIGFLDAVTQGETARVVGRDGTRRTEPVEPLTNYAVGRLSRDFERGRSVVGAMVTAMHRDVDANGPLDYLRSAAYSGGVDARHRFGNGNYELSGWVGGSYVQGSRRAITLTQTGPGHYFQRPDAPHVELDTTRTSLAGFGATAMVFKMSGNWRGGVGGHTRSPGFEVNDVGFQTGADQTIVFGNLRYQQFRPGKHFRQWNLGINPSASWNYEGMLRHRQLNGWFWGQLHSFWSANLWGSRSLGGTSADALRGGPALVQPGAWRGNLNIMTDPRSKVSGNFGVNASRDDAGGNHVNGFGSVAYRPSGSIDLSLNPYVTVRHNPAQYVREADAEGGRHYLFGGLDQTTAGITARLSYTFTPELTLQLYAQPFISAGDYEDFKRVADPRAARFAERFHTFGAGQLEEVRNEAGAVTGYRVDADGDGVRSLAFANPDFNFKELRSNVVLRWQYRPGSTLFLVWSQGRSDHQPYDGSFDIGRDMRRLVNADSGYRDVLGTNVFLVKLNYWLDL